MDGATTRGTARGDELYRAEFRPALAKLRWGVLVLTALMLIASVCMTISIIVSGSRSPAAVAFGLGGGLLMVAVLVGCFIVGWRSVSMAMTVTTTGIDVRGFWIRRWVPWEQVAQIESSDHWYWRRATCIRTRGDGADGGERIIAIVTSYQYILLRSESWDARSRDPREHLLPTRAAIDVHRRFLRGSLASPVPHGPGTMP